MRLSGVTYVSRKSRRKARSRIIKIFAVLIIALILFAFYMYKTGYIPALPW